MIPAIILAAGASWRLGQPKQLVRVADETLLERTIRVVCESGIEAVFVVLGAHREKIAECVDLSRVRVVVNPAWEEGIASSLHAGLRAVAEESPEASGVLLLVCDQPALSAEHLNALLHASDDVRKGGIVASSYAGIAGIPAIFPESQFQNLLALRGDAGARSLLRDPRCPLIEVPFAGGEVDVDTPQDLAATADLPRSKNGVS